MKRIYGVEAPENPNPKTRWTNEVSKIVDSMTILIPREISDLMSKMNSILPDVEFSVLYKVQVNRAEKTISFINPTEFFCPRQEVTGSSVDYLEDNLEYNCVIHKHPRNCTSFSKIDMEYINQNFQVSLLWVVGRGFETGIVNISVPELGRVQIKVIPIIEETIDETLESLVNEKVVKSKPREFVKPKLGFTLADFDLETEFTKHGLF